MDLTCEVAWDFQAHIGNYCWASNIKNQFFKVLHFFEYELSIIFLSCQKVSTPKRNFMLYGVFVKITGTLNN